MRLPYLLCLIILVVIASINAVASVTGSEIETPDNWAIFHTTSATGVSATRFLRSAVADVDDERAGISVPAIETLKTVFTSSKVTSEKIQRWLVKGKSPDIVFVRMHLKKVGDWLFYHPDFSTWVKYVDDLSEKASGKGVSAISTLTTQYGDDALYKIIKEAKQVTSFETLAKKLEAEQMQRWLVIRKDPDEVFHLFKLDEAGNRILSSPTFRAWSKYVDDLSARHPEEPALMAPTLRKYFSDDVLLKMIESAKGVEETKTIAAKVEDDMIQVWLNTRKNPDKAFDELRLVHLRIGKNQKPFFRTLLLFWTRFVDAYKKKNFDKKYEMIETLTRKFGDERVAKMLATAKNQDSMNTIATKLEAAQLKMWFHSGKSTDDVFELLKLYQTAHDFSHSPVFKLWVAYMDVTVTANPRKLATLFLTLENNLDERALIQVLEAAKKFPSMETVAAKMQAEKIQGIFSRKILPEKAFVLIGLSDKQDDAIGNPLFQTWMNYLAAFNKENPKHRESLVMPLHMEYGRDGVTQIIERAMQKPHSVEIAKMMEKAWMKQWLETWETPPQDAFFFLNLHNAGGKTLARPTFKIWTKYLNDFQRRISQNENDDDR